MACSPPRCSRSSPSAPSAVATIVLQACAGIGLSGVAISLQSHVLVVAPARTDIASAWYSASFNVGIAGRPAGGRVVLSTLGVRFTRWSAASWCFWAWLP